VKKLILPLLFLACLVRLPAQTLIGQATLNFYFGVLTDNNGTAIPDGSIVQILASYNGPAIGAATPIDFLGGDTGAVVLWQGGLDSSTSGLAGAASLTLQENLYAEAGNLTTGSTLYLRWYPSLAGTVTSPGVTLYGQYGYATTSGTALDSSWVVGGVGSATDYFFLTTSAGGSLADSAGAAVTSTAVPEPATTAALLGGVGLIFGWFIRRKRS